MRMDEYRGVKLVRLGAQSSRRSVLRSSLRVSSRGGAKGRRAFNKVVGWRRARRASSWHPVSRSTRTSIMEVVKKLYKRIIKRIIRRMPSVKKRGQPDDDGTYENIPWVLVADNWKTRVIRGYEKKARLHESQMA